MKENTAEEIKNRISHKLEKWSEKDLATLETIINALEKEHSNIENIMSFRGFLKDMDEDFKLDLTTRLPQIRLEGSKNS